MMDTFHIALLTSGIINCSVTNWISYVPKDHIYLKQWIEYLLKVHSLGYFLQKLTLYSTNTITREGEEREVTLS